MESSNPLTWRSTTDGFVQDAISYLGRFEIKLEECELTPSFFQPFDTKSPQFLRGMYIVGSSGVFCIVLGIICWTIYMCIGRHADGQSEPLQGWKKRKVPNLRSSVDDSDEDGLKKMVEVHL